MGMELNKNKVCLINQPVGIGDVFFLQKMVDYYIGQGFFVYFPLASNLLYIKDYIIKENLQFCDVNDDFPFKQHFNGHSFIQNENFVYVPAFFSDRFIGGSCLESKYKLINLDFDNWQENFTFIRNRENESQLFYEVLNLKDDENYCFINKRWGTPPNSLTKDVYYEFEGKIIEMELLDNFTVFDWCKVIENAQEISIVDTSLNYLIDKLTLKSKKNFLNSRFTPPNFSHIINLFNTNWIYV